MMAYILIKIDYKLLTDDFDVTSKHLSHVSKSQTLPSTLIDVCGELNIYISILGDLLYQSVWLQQLSSFGPKPAYSKAYTRVTRVESNTGTYQGWENSISNHLNWPLVIRVYYET